MSDNESSSSRSSSTRSAVHFLNRLQREDVTHPDEVSVVAPSLGEHTEVVAHDEHPQPSVVARREHTTVASSEASSGSFSNPLNGMLFTAPTPASTCKGPRFAAPWDREIGGRVLKGGDLQGVQEVFPTPAHSFCSPPVWGPEATQIPKLFCINSANLVRNLKAADEELREQQRRFLTTFGPLLDLTQLLDGSMRPPVAAEVRALSATSYALATNVFEITKLRRSKLIDLFPWKPVAREMFDRFKATWISRPAGPELVTPAMYSDLKGFLDEIVAELKQDEEIRKRLPVKGKERSRPAQPRPSPRYSGNSGSGFKKTRRTQFKRPRTDTGKERTFKRPRPFRAPADKSRYALVRPDLRQEDTSRCRKRFKYKSSESLFSVCQTVTPQPCPTLPRAGGSEPYPKSARPQDYKGGAQQGASCSISVLSGSERDRPSPVHPEREAPQQSTSDPEVQNGGVRDRLRPSQSELLALQDRPPGCLFQHSNGNRFPDPSRVSLEKPVLPLRTNAKRSQPGSSRVHEASETSSGFSASTRPEALHLPRRPVLRSSRAKAKGGSAATLCEAAAKRPRLHSERGEVFSGAVSYSRVPGFCYRLKSNDHLPTRRQAPSASRVGLLASSPGRDLREKSRQSHWHAPSRRSGHQGSKIALPTPSATENLSLEPGRRPLSDHCGPNGSRQSRTELVARVPAGTQTDPLQTGGCSRRCAYRDLYRQLTSYVGGFLRRRRSARCVGRPGKESAHKRARADSSAASSCSLRKQSLRSNPDAADRQQVGTLLSAEDGRHSQCQSISHSDRHLGLVTAPQPRSEPVLHPVQGEQSCRSAVPPAGSAAGVVSQRPSVQIANSHLGSTSVGSLCQLSERQGGPVLCVGSRPAVAGTEFTSGNLSVAAIPASLCLPARKVYRQNDTEAYQLQGREANLDSTSLEDQTVVPTDFGPSGGLSAVPSEPAEPDTRPGRASPPAAGSSKSQPEGMVGFLRRVRSEGFSVKASEYMRLKWSKGSRKTYETHWRGFSSWAARREINPFSATPAEVADYLVHLFHDRDLATSSVGIARSAISCFAGPSDGVPLGEHRRICDLVKAFRKIRPPVARYSATWSIDSLLAYWDTQPENSLLSIKLLTLKCVSLIAIASLSRSDEIAHLLKENYAEEDEGLAFLLSKRPKNCRVGPIPPVYVESVPDRPNICPVVCVREYMAKTQGFRELEDGADRTGLFLSIDSRHCNVKPTTIARWIQNAMTLAGIDTTSFKAHSIRGASVSSLAQKGLSLAQIMKKGRWKSGSTLTRFYIRDLPR